MNTKIIIPIIGIASLFLFSCDENYEHEKSISLAKEVAADVNAEEVETDSSRTVIKSAELSLRVDTVEKRIQQIQQKVNQMQGHILHYEIQSNKNYIDKVEYSLDSSYEVNQINPHAQIRLRIPVEYTDTFIHQMLSMNMRLDEFLLDENDVTEDLFEKKEIAEINISGKTKPKTIIQQSYLEERLAEKIKQKADYARLQHKTKYLWFNISMQGDSYIEKHSVANTETLRTPFYIQAINSLQFGWQGFASFLFGAT
ncbi:MAG: DUF4349 domain-containing protein [Bacteroidetes bacterium]|nr:DUF4349 domain-containing protein [Bacteroidota bacterium]